MPSRKEEQKALKAGHSAEAGGPGGPTANVHAETEAPELEGGSCGSSPRNCACGKRGVADDDDEGDVESEEEEACGSSADSTSWAKARIDVGTIIFVLLDLCSADLVLLMVVCDCSDVERRRW